MYSNKIWMAAAIGLFTLATAKAADPAPVAGQINAEQLQEMLENLGYDVKVEKLASGNTLHWIKIKNKGSTYEVNVNISPSKTKLWTSVGLADVKPEHLAQADRMVKLLELNQKTGPTHFYYYAVHKMIYAAKPMDNRGVTAKLLREHLEDLMTQLATTEEHWDVSKWTTTATVTATSVEKK